MNNAWLAVRSSCIQERSIIRGSSAVEQLTVNQLVVGSNPTPGAISDEQGTLWVVDHKTASRAFSEHQIDADLQLMIYAAAVEQLDIVEGREKRYRFDVLTKTKKPKFLQYRLYKDDVSISRNTELLFGNFFGKFI